MEVDIKPHLPIMVSTARLQLELGMHMRINASCHGVTVTNDYSRELSMTNDIPKA